jgi:transcriptional regulator with GAF, ATPase, and Fis domain
MEKNMTSDPCCTEVLKNKDLMELLCCIANDLSFRMSPSSLLSHVFDRLARIMRVEGTSLLLMNEETNLLEFAVVKGMNAQALKELNLRLKPSEGLAGWVFANNKPLRVETPKEDSRFQPGADLLTGFETRNLLAVPLRLNGKIVGVLEFLNRRKKDPFTDADESLAEAIAALLSSTVDNLRVVAGMERTQFMLRSLLEHLEGGFVAVNRDGVVTHVNVRASELFDWASPPLGRPMVEAFSISPELEQWITQVLREEKPLIHRRLAFGLEGQGRKEVDTLIFPITAPGQPILGAIIKLT